MREGTLPVLAHHLESHGCVLHPSLIPMCVAGNVGGRMFEVSLFILGGNYVGMANMPFMAI